MKRINCVLFFLLLLIACNTHEKKKEGGQSVEKTRLLQLIERSDCVYLGGGITGEYNEIYMSFLKLDKLYSDSAWMQLSSSNSPIIRLYSFEALKRRESALLMNAKKMLIKDSSNVCIINNDIKLSCTIGFYVSKS